MSRADEAAFPIQESDFSGSIPAQHGLTIREHFAAMAMQGLIQGGEYPKKYIACQTAEDAVHYADALIAELAKPVTP